MRLLRDFVCEECGETTERYVDSEITQCICDCGHTATRIIGMPHVALDGTDPGFPGAYDKWARVREDRHKQLHRKGDNRR